MGIVSSHHPIADFSQAFEWEISKCEDPDYKMYAISPVFQQEKENFVAFFNRDICTLFIYCCSASQWQYDEVFSFSIDVAQPGQTTIQTTSNFTKKHPFSSIALHDVGDSISILINLCQDYPYTRKDHYLGLLNSGSTCYMATIIQVLFHTGAFRNLIYSYRDPPVAPAALQNLFIELQLSSRAPSIDPFIRALGSFRDLAFVQNDANEFLIGIFERLETDLGPSFTEGLNSIFGGATDHVIECKNGKVITKTEKFYTFPIAVDGLKSLHESLTLMTAKEKIEDYDAGDDIGHCEATQSIFFSALPPVLSLQLCRFQYSPVKDAVVELRNLFTCPFEFDIKEFTLNYEGETEYELYAISAHSGNPVFGHYMSYIRTGLQDQWILFNDGSTKPVDIAAVNRLFGHSKSEQPSFFKTFTFNTSIAYMLFYVRKDCQNLVCPSDYIPLHLVPHRSQIFFSKFIFADEMIDQPINTDSPPLQWLDQKKSIYEIVHQIQPERDLSNLVAYIRLPGKSQFIGPLELSTRAASFVIRGHSSTIYLTPKSIRSPLYFLVTETPPRQCLAITNDIETATPENCIPMHQLRRFSPLKACSGSVIVSQSVKNVVLKFNMIRFVMNPSATYSDVQLKLSTFISEDPSKILLLSNNEPMLPSNIPFVKSFPSKSQFSYQILSTHVTVCSISLYTPITILFVSHQYVQQLSLPVWIRKGTNCKQIVDIVLKILKRQDSMSKFEYICSRGTGSKIEMFLDPRASPKKECIRIDTIRDKNEVPANRARLRSLMKASKNVCIEVRFTHNITSGDFQGISRILAITPKTTCLELCEKMKSMNRSTMMDQPKSAYLFVHEKKKISLPVQMDDVLYPILKQLATKMTRNEQRACIAFIAEDSIIAAQPMSGITRSLSGIINNHETKELPRTPSALEP